MTHRGMLTTSRWSDPSHRLQLLAESIGLEIEFDRATIRANTRDVAYAVRGTAFQVVGFEKEVCKIYG